MEYNIPLLKDKPQAHLSKQRKIILTNLSPIIDLKKKKRSVNKVGIQGNFDHGHL